MASWRTQQVVNPAYQQRKTRQHRVQQVRTQQLSTEHHSSRRRHVTTVCAAKDREGKFVPNRLAQAAQDYAKGLRDGIDEDELVAQELGVQSADQLTDVQQKYKDRIKQKLADEAEQRRREMAARSRQFTLGKLAYSRGQYPASAKLFEQALDQEGPFSKFGGEIQLWQALAYQACGREEECIAVYKGIENAHPNPVLRKQAADLRFIMEAPKLKLRPEERVSIPVLSNVDRYTPDRSNAPRPRPPPQKQQSQRKKTWEEEFFDSYKPPNLVPNRYVFIASIIVGAGLAWYSAAIK